MATGAASGLSGTATWGGSTIEDVRDIDVESINDVKEYRSSSTAGHMHRVAGGTDSQGTFSVFFPTTGGPIAPTNASLTAILPFQKGETGTLVLTSNGSQELFNGAARIISIRYRVPIETGDLLEAVVTFGQTTGA